MLPTGALMAFLWVAQSRDHQPSVSRCEPFGQNSCTHYGILFPKLDSIYQGRKKEVLELAPAMHNQAYSCLQRRPILPTQGLCTRLSQRRCWRPCVQSRPEVSQGASELMAKLPSIVLHFHCQAYLPRIPIAVSIQAPRLFFI